MHFRASYQRLLFERSRVEIWLFAKPWQLLARLTPAAFQIADFTAERILSTNCIFGQTRFCGRQKQSPNKSMLFYLQNFIFWSQVSYSDKKVLNYLLQQLKRGPKTMGSPLPPHFRKVVPPQATSISTAMVKRSGGSHKLRKLNRGDITIGVVEAP